MQILYQLVAEKIQGYDKVQERSQCSVLDIRGSSASSEIEPVSEEQENACITQTGKF